MRRVNGGVPSWTPTAHMCQVQHMGGPAPVLQEKLELLIEAHGQLHVGGVGPQEGPALSDGAAVLSHVRGWC